MRIFFTTLALIAALSGAAYAKDSETHSIIVATDTHFISPALTDHGAYFTSMIANGDGKLVMYCEALMDAFIEQVLASRPDCVLLSGDLTFNGAKKSHEDLALRLRRIHDAGIPVYVTPGNHDINSGAAAAFHGDTYTRTANVSPQEFEAIYHDLGFAQALSRDPHSLSYIAEPFRGLRILMTDVNVPGSVGRVTPDTLRWLNGVLAAAKTDGAKVIAVTHQNLYAHSSLLSKGFVIENAGDLLDLYQRCGVSVNLSGHMHLQHTMHTDDGGVPEIATSSLAVAPCQYGVITLSGGRAQYRTEPVDVAAWAAASGKDDKRLLDFPGFAERFFKGVSEIHPPKAYAAETERAADALIADINYAYFSGRMHTLPEDVSLISDWLAQPGFFSAYIASILADVRIDHNHLDFSL